MELRRGYKQTEVGVIPVDWEDGLLGNSIQEMTDYVAAGSFEALKDNVSVYDSPNHAIYVRLYDLRLGLGHSNQKYVDEKSYKFLNKSNLIGNEILLANIGANVGEAFLMQCGIGKATIAPNMIIIRTNDNNLRYDYLIQYLKSNFGRAKIDELIAGSGHPKINKTDLKKCKVVKPPVSEQLLIAEMLSDADVLISSVETLITKKLHIKQGAMQELLKPKEGWVEKTLGDLLTIRHGKSQHAVVDENGEYPVLATGGQIGNANTFLYDKPSVLIGRKGTIDRPQYMDQPFWTVDTLFFSEIHKPNNAKYLFYQFGLIDWRRHNEASGVPSLNATTIENIEIKIPDPSKQPDEQARIATILSDMDAEITVLEKKLTKTRQLKQGMMAELLTGRIRLV